MPALGTRIPGSRRTRVLEWYQEHPGYHRCQDVAADLGEPTQPIAVASRNLWLRDDIERIHVERPNGGKPAVLYGTDPRLARQCPDCGAPAGARCVRIGTSKPIKSFHTGRQEATA